jgi:hypothetical protein
MRILRGDDIDDSEHLKVSAATEEKNAGSRRYNLIARSRKVRGEDDTDRDMRLAKESQRQHLYHPDTQGAIKSSNAPLLDSSGHIALFPDQPVSKSKEGQEKKKESIESRMRFSDARGYHKDIKQGPWYSSMGLASGVDASVTATVSHDVWGREDTGRRARQTQRLANDDPLAAMKRGVKRVKEAKGERIKWQKEQRRTIAHLDLVGNPSSLDYHESYSRSRARHHSRSYTHGSSKKD